MDPSRLILGIKCIDIVRCVRYLPAFNGTQIREVHRD